MFKAYSLFVGLVIGSKVVLVSPIAVRISPMMVIIGLLCHVYFTYRAVREEFNSSN